jgi:hypothetical protein
MAFKKYVDYSPSSFIVLTDEPLHFDKREFTWR